MFSIGRPVSGENFVDRVDLLKQIHAIYPVDNIALVGPRRIGKSSIAEQFLLTLKQKNTIRFRFNVQSNMGTPGKFGLRMLRSFLSSYFDQFSDMADPGLEEMEINPSILSNAAKHINSETLYKLSRFLGSYFPPSPENERAVLERILCFLDEFSIEMGVNAAIVLDEFQEIIGLDKYGDFRNGKVLPFLENIISGQKNVWYLFTGSAVRIMTRIFEGEDAAYHGRVKRFHVQTFNKDDTLKLICKCTDKPISAEALHLLYTLSNGHPFYTVVIISAAHTISEGSAIINKHHVEEAFISELSGGILDSHCNYLFDTSLGRVRSDALLREILREISSGETSLTGLSARIGRSTGYLSLPLRNLYNLDLIDKKNTKYYIADHVLQIWLRTVYGQNEPNLTIIREKISENYREYIATMSSELGIYFESYMREVLQKFAGQKFKESIFLMNQARCSANRPILKLTRFAKGTRTGFVSLNMERNP
jgi:AAA+ ATPase superfamily predicted ATPase